MENCPRQREGLEVVPGFASTLFGARDLQFGGGGFITLRDLAEISHAQLSELPRTASGLKEKQDQGEGGDINLTLLEVLSSGIDEGSEFLVIERPLYGVERENRTALVVAPKPERHQVIDRFAGDAVVALGVASALGTP